MPQFVPDEVGHLDIAGPDLAKLTAFYTAVFDWEISPRGPGCSMVTTPGSGPNAALVEAETSSIVAGIVVSDLAASIAKALEGGGREVMPPVDNGWVTKAQIRDPAGNLLTLIQN